MRGGYFHPIVFIILVASSLLSCSVSESRIQSGEMGTILFTYSVEVTDIPSDSKRLDIYIPVPNDNTYQTIEDIVVDAAIPFELTSDPDYGNVILHLWRERDGIDNQTATVHFVATRELADGFISGPRMNRQVNPLFLKSNRLVPIDGRVAAEADAIWKDEESTLANVSAVYEHLFETMRYDKSGTGWGQGDAVRACNVRSGNCTDIHSLFIGMLRSKGVPARFTIGFPLPEDKESGAIRGYHCWAEFFDEYHGWIPVDLSEAIKHPDKKDFYFGKLDADRVAFSTGRDIKIETSPADKPRNYFIYPYVLVDGKEFGNTTSTLLFSRLGS